MLSIPFSAADFLAGVIFGLIVAVAVSLLWEWFD